ncbi:hypothetical protein [Candidatus Nitrosarchaeum limnium]|uniref:hypothetical protein n=1 Tax=Candidatus Nitrosarchaeum limnium TaxID=1007084 RepID=UPI00026CE390|nr:hypothetical protein [Candidatus Nitrosarchaeum limnium]
MSETLFGSLGTSERVLKLLRSTESYGGPQSVEDVCTNLKMKKKNAASILSRLCKREKIERIGKGTYKIAGDARPYNKSKPHYKQ